MAKRLEGKVALVFGAGSVGPGWGNGKATAVLFAREGAKVVGVDVNPAAAEETRAIVAEAGGTCNAEVADVTKSDQIRAVVDRTIERYGRIDVLHNNVGITEMGGAGRAFRGELASRHRTLTRQASSSPANTCFRSWKSRAMERSSTSPRSPPFVTPDIRTSPITPPRRRSINSRSDSRSNTRPKASG